MEELFLGAKNKLITTLTEEINLLKEEAMAELEEKVKVAANKQLVKQGKSFENENFKLKTSIEIIRLCHLGMTEDYDENQFNERLGYILDAVNVSEDCDIVLALLETLVKIPDIKNKLSREISNNLINLLTSFLIKSYSENKEEIYFYSAKLLIILSESYSKAHINKHLLEKYKSIVENISLCLWFPLFSEWMKLISMHGFSKEFTIMYNDMLTNGRKYKNEMSIETFNRLLWYGFITEYDSNFLDIIQNKNLIQNNSEVKQIYDNFYDVYNKKPLNLSLIKNIISRLKNSNFFNAREIEAITNKINFKVQMKISRERVQDRTEPIRTVKYVVRLSDNNLPYEVKMNDLKQEKIKLIVYKHKSFIDPIDTIAVDGLSNSPGAGDVYVTKRIRKELEKRIKHGYIKVLDNLPGFRLINTKNVLTKNANKVAPTTSKANDKIDVTLRDKSELRDLGYQISGLSRSRRWELLERAVPILGLKKVVYIIVHNVRLRKGQTNGEIKFKYGITEWEFDLKRLKQKYYKNDFHWPDT